MLLQPAMSMLESAVAQTVAWQFHDAHELQDTWVCQWLLLGGVLQTQ